MATREFSREEARAIGERIGIDWEAGHVDLEQFRMGLSVELEHGNQDPATDVTGDDEVITGKIALRTYMRSRTTTRGWPRWSGMRRPSPKRSPFGTWTET